MDSETATLIIQAEGAFISILMGVIGYFHVVNNKNIHKRMDKQDEEMSTLAGFIRDQQEQISLLASKIDETLKLVDNNQKNDSERMKFMQDLILKQA